MVSALPGRLDSGLVEEPHRLRARQPPIARKRIRRELRAAIDLRLGEPELRVPSGLCSRQARGAQREQPADILGQREVDGAADEPGTQDPSFRDRVLDSRDGAGAQPGADRPERLGVVLGLHRAEPAHHIGRPITAGTRDDALADQAAKADCRGCHAPQHDER